MTPQMIADLIREARQEARAAALQEAVQWHQEQSAKSYAVEAEHRMAKQAIMAKPAVDTFDGVRLASAHDQMEAACSARITHELSASHFRSLSQPEKKGEAE
jgi:hypothetical protein